MNSALPLQRHRIDTWLEHQDHFSHRAVAVWAFLTPARLWRDVGGSLERGPGGQNGPVVPGEGGCPWMGLGSGEGRWPLQVLA